MVKDDTAQADSVKPKYVVKIGKLLELHFERLDDAKEFVAGFNYARRQRDKILYEFKSSYKTRGFRYANQVREWCERIREWQLWLATRAHLLTAEGEVSRVKRTSRKTPPREPAAEVHSRLDGSPPESE